MIPGYLSPSFCVTSHMLYAWSMKMRTKPIRRSQWRFILCIIRIDDSSTIGMIGYFWNFGFYFIFSISFGFELITSKFFFSLKRVQRTVIEANDLCIFHNASDKYNTCIKLTFGFQCTRWLVSMQNDRWFIRFGPIWFVYVLINLIQFNQPNIIETGKKDEKVNWPSKQTHKRQTPNQTFSLHFNSKNPTFLISIIVNN